MRGSIVDGRMNRRQHSADERIATGVDEVLSVFAVPKDNVRGTSVGASNFNDPAGSGPVANRASSNRDPIACLCPHQYSSVIGCLARLRVVVGGQCAEHAGGDAVNQRANPRPLDGSEAARDTPERSVVVRATSAMCVGEGSTR